MEPRGPQRGIVSAPLPRLDPSFKIFTLTFRHPGRRGRTCEYRV